VTACDSIEGRYRKLCPNRFVRGLSAAVSGLSHIENITPRKLTAWEPHRNLTLDAAEPLAGLAFVQIRVPSTLMKLVSIQTS
jgi:hypothetical protein